MEWNNKQNGFIGIVEFGCSCSAARKKTRKKQTNQTRTSRCVGRGYLSAARDLAQSNRTHNAEPNDENFATAAATSNEFILCKSRLNFSIMIMMVIITYHNSLPHPSTNVHIFCRPAHVCVCVSARSRLIDRDRKGQKQKGRWSTGIECNDRESFDSFEWMMGEFQFGNDRLVSFHTASFLEIARRTINKDNKRNYRFRLINFHAHTRARTPAHRTPNKSEWKRIKRNDLAEIFTQRATETQKVKLGKIREREKSRNNNNIVIGGDSGPKRSRRTERR